MNREQFEKLDVVSSQIKTHKLRFNKKLKIFCGLDGKATEQAKWVNGAWYAYQEQQKKIEAIKKLIISLRGEFDLWSDDGEGFDAIEAQIENLEDFIK